MLNTYQNSRNNPLNFSCLVHINKLTSLANQNHTVWKIPGLHTPTHPPWIVCWFLSKNVFTRLSVRIPKPINRISASSPCCHLSAFPQGYSSWDTNHFSHSHLLTAFPFLLAPPGSSWLLPQPVPTQSISLGSLKTPLATSTLAHALHCILLGSSRNAQTSLPYVDPAFLRIHFLLLALFNGEYSFSYTRTDTIILVKHFLCHFQTIAFPPCIIFLLRDSWYLPIPHSTSSLYHYYDPMIIHTTARTSASIFL